MPFIPSNFQTCQTFVANPYTYVLFLLKLKTNHSSEYRGGFDLLQTANGETLESVFRLWNPVSQNRQTVGEEETIHRSVLLDMPDFEYS